MQENTRRDGQKSFKNFIIGRWWVDMGKKNHRQDAEYGPRVRLKGSEIVPGKWTATENRKYLNFLLENRHKLQNYDLRLSYGIYQAMSNRIPGRTSDQCRGHHRRMVQTYKTIDQILKKCQPPTKSQHEYKKRYKYEYEQEYGQIQRMLVRVSQCKQEEHIGPTINIMVILDTDSICQW